MTLIGYERALLSDSSLCLTKIPISACSTISHHFPPLEVFTLTYFWLSLQIPTSKSNSWTEKEKELEKRKKPL